MLWLSSMRIVCTAAAFLALACSAPPEPPGQTYTVRGEVRQLPDPSRPGSELFVHHEAIPTFVGIDGEVQPMGSMLMPLPVRDQSALEGVEVGDKIEVDLRVAWDGDPPLLVVRLERLPDTAVLRLD